MTVEIAYMFFLLWKFEDSLPDFAVIQATGESCAAMYRCKRDFLGQTEAIRL